MKSSTLPLFLALVITSCVQNGKVQQNDDASAMNSTSSFNAMAITIDDVNQKIEDLKFLTPLTSEQLKTLFPEAINGIKRSSMNTNSPEGLNVVEANYSQGNKDLKLTIYDCAGEAGAGIFALGYVAQMNLQSESNKGYTRAMDFNGAKAIEAYEKSSNQSTFTYIINDRFMIVLTGKNIDNASLRQMAQDLTFKV
ncbi:MAG TPA: hypothetical protein VD794_03620 [Flavisolibacter sp.]|nr:hypothetical protein [Flavisolibacter sp.]